MEALDVMQEQSTDTVAMLDRAVCFVLRISSVGNTRKVSTSQVQTDADKTMIAVNKRLFDSSEFRAIKKLDGEIRQFMYSRSLPAFFLRDGMSLLPFPLIPEIESKLAEFKARRDDLVREFVSVYPSLVQDAEVRLRSLFNPADYLSAGDVARQFALEYQYVSFATPEKLCAVNPELFAREQAKLQDTWNNAQIAVREVLRAELADLVTHLVDRLSGNRDGKPKIFRDSMLENVRDFLSTFDARNITSDSDLAVLIERTKSLLSGVSPEYLRNSETLRARVASGFAEVKQALDGMMADKPSRSITFED